MNTTFTELMNEDREMKVGDDVTIYWTNSHRYFKATGKVSKLNEKSVKVSINEEIMGERGVLWYEKGREITVPRFGAMSKTWSNNNCVRKGK